jgi:hypothetical protein
LWLIPVILATWKAEIRRIVVQSQLGQIVQETLSQKNLYKNRAGGVAQGEGPEFKPQYCKKQKQKQKPVLPKRKRKNPSMFYFIYVYIYRTS